MDLAVADRDVATVIGDADVDVDVGAECSEIGDEGCSVRVAGVLLETRHVRLLSGPSRCRLALADVGRRARLTDDVGHGVAEVPFDAAALEFCGGTSFVEVARDGLCAGVDEEGFGVVVLLGHEVPFIVL